ncbi:ABC transporter permease [Halosimplex litoreum]|uniref:ABC transporter permease n=1 Tax=Halosimplex litoreum TaxID=1198301 RepID=A0A7T3G069_9EURY|nr:ABC transporter permease [Halosimplex litoreum]QPV63817.1 ABC transporter permease [Halosimplex litoreum]
MTSRLRYFFRRLGLSIPVLLFGTTVTFVAIRFGPVDPVAAILGDPTNAAATEEYERIRAQLGLDEPLWQQYVEFLGGLVTLDLGQSWVIAPNTGTVSLIATYAPRTIWLGFWAVLIAIFVGVPLGFFAGTRANTGSDYVASILGIVWRAMPNFWLAVILVSVLSQSDALLGFSWQQLGPDVTVTGAPDLTELGSPSGFLAAVKQVLPAAVVLGSASMGNEMRIGRTAVLETISEKYVETARANGVPNHRVVWKHVFRNALIPLVPIITGEAFVLLGGSVLVETVFGIHGMGWLFYRASIQGDLPLVGSLMVVFIVLIVAVNILQDLLYVLIDPRIGYTD